MPADPRGVGWCTANGLGADGIGMAVADGTPRLEGGLSLTNQSNTLAALGRSEDALAAVTEAVQIHRELAAARPDTFRPDLARSLTSLGITLTELGDFDAALSAAAPEG